MIAALILGLLKANLAASVVIVLVLVLRKPVRRLFGARVAYGLWLAPLLGAAAVLLPARAAAPIVVTSLPAVSAIAAPAPVDPWALAGAAWLVGAGLSLGWLALRQARFVKDMRRGRAGPAVVGFFQPKVVLPNDFAIHYTAPERAVVMAHETMHLSRQDARIAAAAAVTRCINWFNPLVHVAVFHLRLDQELACDAQVVGADPGMARAYAQTMLKAQLSASPLTLGCAWPAGPAHPLTERIALLAERRPTDRRMLGGAGVVALVATGSGVAAWAAQPATPVVIVVAQAAAPTVAADAALPAAVTIIRPPRATRPARIARAVEQVAEAAPAAPAAAPTPPASPAIPASAAQAETQPDAMPAKDKPAKRRAKTYVLAERAQMDVQAQIERRAEINAAIAASQADRTRALANRRSEADLAAIHKAAADARAAGEVARENGLRIAAQARYNAQRLNEPAVRPEDEPPEH